MGRERGWGRKRIQDFGDVPSVCHRREGRTRKLTGMMGDGILIIAFSAACIIYCSGRRLSFLWTVLGIDCASTLTAIALFSLASLAGCGSHWQLGRFVIDLLAYRATGAAGPPHLQRAGGCRRDATADCQCVRRFEANSGAFRSTPGSRRSLNVASAAVDLWNFVGSGAVGAVDCPQAFGQC